MHQEEGSDTRGSGSHGLCHVRCVRQIRLCFIYVEPHPDTQAGLVSLAALRYADGRLLINSQCLSQGLLKPEGRQVLNQLGFYVFLPALAFTKLAQTVSWAKLRLWWPLPLNVLLR